jgi:hypothetical protein
MRLFGLKITRASDKETEDIALGVFHHDGSVNLHGVAMGIVNIRHRLGGIESKLMIIGAIVVVLNGAQNPVVKAILAPAAAFGATIISTNFERVDNVIVTMLQETP